MTVRISKIEQMVLCRYPPKRGWVLLREVQCGKHRIDLLAVRARADGLPPTLVAIEIKVSVADFLREMKQPEKTKAWRERVSRFYFCTPNRMLESKHKGLMHGGDGLLEVGKNVRETMVARLLEPSAEKTIAASAAALARMIWEPNAQHLNNWADKSKYDDRFKAETYTRPPRVWYASTDKFQVNPWRDDNG